MEQEPRGGQDGAEWRPLWLVLYERLGAKTLTALAGLGMVGYGVGQIYQPAAWIVVGASLALTAVISTAIRAIARARSRGDG